MDVISSEWKAGEPDPQEVQRVAREHPGWFLTADGKPITDGMRLWNYYDMRPGVISFRESGITRRFFDGWFRMIEDDGRTTLINGERLATGLPRELRPDGAPEDGSVPPWNDERLPDLLAALAGGATLTVPVQAPALGHDTGGVAVSYEPRAAADPTPWRDHVHYRRHASRDIVVQPPAGAAREQEDAVQEPDAQEPDVQGTQAQAAPGNPADAGLKPGMVPLPADGVAWLLLPANDTTNALQLARRVHRVRVDADGVRVLEPDDTPLRHVLTHAEAGVVDHDGWWAAPLPGTLLQVTRDNVPVSPLLEADELGLALTAWMMRNTSTSMDWAFRHEGYASVEISSPHLSALPTSYERYAALVGEEYTDPHAACRGAETLPVLPEFAEWGYRYWVQVLGYAEEPDRKYRCPHCGKPNGH